MVPTVRRLVPGGVDGALDAADLAAGAADAVRHGGAFVSPLGTAHGTPTGADDHALAADGLRGRDRTAAANHE